MKSTKKIVKNSKKAFTLVELVVVIAVLAIVAAIAIPAVISIVNSATKSSVDTDAASIDSAVKTFHAGIVNGIIYQENLPASVTTVGTFPTRNSGNGARSSYANTQATIQQAMQYEGIWDRLQSGINVGAGGTPNFGYLDGSIVAAIDGDGNALPNVGVGATNIKVIDNTFATRAGSVGTALSRN